MNQRWKLDQWVRLALTAGLSVAVASAAGAKPRIGHTVDARGALLTVNGVTVTRLKSVARSEAIEDRLRALPSSRVKFTVAKVADGWSVVSGGRALLAPTHEDAAKQGVNRHALAHCWASILASAWQTPFLRLSPGGAVVGVGMERHLRIGGAATGVIQLQVSPSNAADASIGKRGIVVVVGRTPGRASITVTRSGVSATSALLVMRPAGTVRDVSINVTGTAIPRDVLDNAVDAELGSAVRLEPGCWSVFKSHPRFPRVWTRGDRLDTSIPVRLAGPGYLATQDAVGVHIVRKRLPPALESVLFYSNHPESVGRPQTLFRHSLSGSVAARLLYHHVNKALQPLDMTVDIENTGPDAAAVQVMNSAAIGHEDIVLAGHTAAYTFLKRSLDGVGRIVTVPAHGRLQVMDRRLGSQDTLSGLMVVRAVSDAKLIVTMRAEDPKRITRTVVSAEETNTVFPDPDKTLDVSYAVGGPWAYVPIGRYPISNLSGVRLDGNYGVLYTVRLHLTNPTARRCSVKVLFEAQAGAARGAFIIDGALTETPQTYPPAETRVLTVSLAPSQKRSVTIVTMPAAGGAYPAGLVVHG